MRASNSKIIIDRALIMLNGFGKCGRCKDLDKPCGICKVPFKYHARVLQQPYASVVLYPPKIYEYIFDTRLEKKPPILVPYFMVVIGYSSTIDILRFQLDPTDDDPKYTQNVREKKAKVFPMYEERLKTFVTEADAAYLIEDAEKGRLAIIQAMEKMIVFGLACLEEINQRPNDEDMFNKMLRKGEKNYTNKLHEAQQEMVSNEQFNADWKAYKIGQMYKKEKEAGMDVD